MKRAAHWIILSPTAAAIPGTSGSMFTRARGECGGEIREPPGPGDQALGMPATPASRRRSRRRPRRYRNSRSPPRSPRLPADSRRGHSCRRSRCPGSQRQWHNTPQRSRTSLAAPYRSWFLSWFPSWCSSGARASCCAAGPGETAACCGDCPSGCGVCCGDRLWLSVVPRSPLLRPPRPPPFRPAPPSTW